MYSSILQLFSFTSAGARLLRHGSLLLVLALTFALCPAARAVNPPPDGGYPNGNTAEGDNALLSLTADNHDNTAIGFEALRNNNDASDNTAIGSGALRSNTTGFFNTATGIAALFSNLNGNNDTATGAAALELNITGLFNTATGAGALENNTAGNNNTATGSGALQGNTTGSNNTANGSEALLNRSGFNDTATGYQALTKNTTGHHNTADGVQSLQNNTTGSFNIAVGNVAGHNLTTGSNNIDIGNQGVAAEAKTIRIGEQGNQSRTFVAGISGVAVTGPAVHVSAGGQLGIVPSSARFKDEIEPMAHASEAVLKLKPVTFHYKDQLDPDRTPQFGLIAEEVEKVDPKLVFHDEQGKPFTVRYEAVNAMLLNEFLKEHRQVQEQRADLVEMKSVFLKQEELIARQQKQIEALSATVRKIGERADLPAPAPEIAMNED